MSAVLKNLDYCVIEFTAFYMLEYIQRNTFPAIERNAECVNHSWKATEDQVHFAYKNSRLGQDSWLLQDALPLVLFQPLH